MNMQIQALILLILSPGVVGALVWVYLRSKQKPLKPAHIAYWVGVACVALLIYLQPVHSHLDFGVFNFGIPFLASALLSAIPYFILTRVGAKLLTVR